MTKARHKKKDVQKLEDRIFVINRWGNYILNTTFWGGVIQEGRGVVQEGELFFQCNLFTSDQKRNSVQTDAVQYSVQTDAN